MELVSLPQFLRNFWRKIFLMLYSINWPRFIAWWLLILEIFGNMCIAIICCPVSLFINPCLFVSSFFYITKEWRQKCKYLKYLFIRNKNKKLKIILKGIFRPKSLLCTYFPKEYLLARKKRLGSRYLTIKKGSCF